MTIPVVFKGASGVNAINVVLSNEADVLPASTDGTVSDYSGSGTTIRVFEGAAELTYGTGNGQFQVNVSGSGITAGTPSTVGNTRVYGVASNMTLDNATLTFTITGKTASGISFSLTKVQTFAKSRTGQKGADGTSITLVDVEFAKNTNPTTAPTTGWTTTAPAITGTEQLWTRTKTTYSSGNPTYSTPANITPKKGDTGAEGQGVESVTEEYAISTSKTTQPTTGWSTTQPTWSSGMYIWSRVKVVYKNPASIVYTGYAVSSEWEAVNNVQIGGRNLIAKKYIKDWNLVSSSIVVQGSDDDGDYLGVNQAILYTTVGGGGAYNDIFQGKIHYNEYTQYALKVKWKMAATQANNGLMLRFKYSDGTYSEYISLSGSNTTLTEKSIISEVGKTVSGISCVYGESTNRSLIYDIQMTEGNKHTAGYSVAPEDVQAAIDAEKNRINDILSDNVADPSEKQYLSNLWQEIYAEYPRIWAQADTYAVDKSNYEAKYSALNTLLSPVLANCCC